VRAKDTIVAVIEAIADTSIYYENAIKFTNMGVMKDLVRFITESQDFRSYVVHISIEAIWNLIEVVGQQAIDSLASDADSVLSLRLPFERVIKEGYKYDDKCLRNEFAVLINYIATSISSHQVFLETDSRTGTDSTFLEFLIKNAIYDEVTPNNGPAGTKKFQLTAKDEDIELKKLLLTGVLYLVRDPSNTQAHQTLIDTGFIRAMLLFLDPNTTVPSILRY
jgi:cilia- and flagella-associated protein 69